MLERSFYADIQEAPAFRRERVNKSRGSKKTKSIKLKALSYLHSDNSPILLNHPVPDYLTINSVPCLVTYKVVAQQLRINLMLLSGCENAPSSLTCSYQIVCVGVKKNLMEFLLNIKVRIHHNIQSALKGFLSGFRGAGFSFICRL